MTFGSDIGQILIVRLLVVTVCQKADSIKLAELVKTQKGHDLCNNVNFWEV